MKTRLLRDAEAAELGMGCMAFSHGYGKIPSEGYSIEAIRSHLKDFIALLQTNWVDLYYLHRMGSVPAEEVAEAMGRLSFPAAWRTASGSCPFHPSPAASVPAVYFSR